MEDGRHDASKREVAVRIRGPVRTSGEDAMLYEGLKTLISNALIDKINSLSAIYNPEPPPDDVLYHYTDFAGLHGILESHNLRATYTKVLNDASEQVHAERALREELERLNTLPQPRTISFEERKHFVTCFCESPELLSMWRNYAGGGGGCCLGFRYSGLKNNMWWPDAKVLPLLVPVTYGSTPEQICKYLIALCKMESSPDNPSLMLPPFFPSMIKHKAFKEEREWRIIALAPPVEQMKFSPGSANIRPYVELSCLPNSGAGGRLPLVSVTFGPTLRPEDRPEEIIGWMLEKNGYTGVSVRSSDIPFRL